METSIYYAVRTLHKSDINTFPVKVDDIEQIINERGFKIQRYSLTSDETMNTFKRNNLYDIAKQRSGFTYVSESRKIIFFRDTLSNNEKRIVLAHELGHIVMGHAAPCGIIGFSDNYLIDSAQEKEANEFAVAFLAPPCVMYRAHIKTVEAIADNTLLDKDSAAIAARFIGEIGKLSSVENELCTRFSEFINKSTRKYNIFCTLGTSVFIAACIAGIICFNYIFSFTPKPSNQPVPGVTQHPSVTTHPDPRETSGKIVVVTKSGTRYHLPECRHVKNKTNTAEIDVQTAVSMGYTPCKDCNP